MFFFNFKSYVASYGYVRRPGTDRIPEGVKKSYDGTGILIPVEKVPPERKKTGIRRIPARICNLLAQEHLVDEEEGKNPKDYNCTGFKDNDFEDNDDSKDVISPSRKQVLVITY